jgi:hypothetical protein
MEINEWFAIPYVKVGGIRNECLDPDNPVGGFASNYRTESQEKNKKHQIGKPKSVFSNIPKFNGCINRFDWFIWYFDC